MADELTSPISIFYSYTHRDETLRNELEKHLSALRQQKIIREWYDHKITAGANWSEEIDTHLNTAQIILLLLSSDFLASDYCSGVEMKRALERHKTGEARVIPIILRSVDWKNTPFGELQVLPSNERPVSSWHGRFGRDKAFVNIVEGIRAVIKEFQDQKASLVELPLSHPGGEGSDIALEFHHESIFPMNELIIDPAEFYGRRRELATLLESTRSRISTSIVGPFGIGKTWLMRYLMLVAPKELGFNFRIVYIDATMPSCSTLRDFALVVLEKLDFTSFTIPIGFPPTTYLFLQVERALKRLRRENSEILVLCVDELDDVAYREDADIFFKYFRSFASNGELILVTASRREIYRLEKQFSGPSSPLSSILEPIMLEPFSLTEAKAFVLAKGTQARLTDQEQVYLLKYGQIDTYQWHPLRLQLAGKMLLTDKNLGAKEDISYYQPTDPEYWQEFEKRLDKVYRAMIREN